VITRLVAIPSRSFSRPPRPVVADPLIEQGEAAARRQIET